MDIKNTIKLQMQLEKHEGKHKKWYPDTKGYWTNGIGHKATKFDDIKKDWTDQDVAQNFIKDCYIAESELDKQSWYQGLDEIRKCVLVNMVFNMGMSRVLEFKNTLAFIKAGKFKQASVEMLDSKWAREDVARWRSGELSIQMETGQWQF